MKPHFTLWLEFEEYERTYPSPADDPSVDFCNALVTLQDGTKYGLNIWTFGYMEWLTRHSEDGMLLPEARAFIVPPDLLVKHLERHAITIVLEEVLRDGVPSNWQHVQPGESIMETPID